MPRGSAHRQVLLKSLIENHLSYTTRNVHILDDSKVPVLLRTLQAHALLRPDDMVSPFATPTPPPSEGDKEGAQTIKVHYQTISKFISALDRLITSQDDGTRCGGLMLLQEVIVQCPYSVLQEKMTAWINLSLERCKKMSSQKDGWMPSALNELILSLIVLQRVMERAQALPSLRSALLQGLLASLPNFLFQFLQRSQHTDLVEESLRTLRAIAANIPSLLKSHYVRAQTAFVALLGNDHTIIRELACQSVALLPQCNRQKESQQMSGVVTRTLTALHDLLNLLYRKADTFVDKSWNDAYNQPDAKDEFAFDVQFLHDESFSSAAEIQAHFSTLCLYVRSFLRILANLLEHTYSGVVEYPVDELMEGIERVFALDPEWLFHQRSGNKMDQSHVIQLLAMLPILHQDAMVLLLSMVRRLRHHLLAWCPALSGLIVRLFSYYHVQNSPFEGSFRAQVSRIACECIQLFGVNTNETLVLPLVQEIIAQYDDMHSVATRQTQVTALTVNKSKRKRKRNAPANSDRHFDHLSILEDQLPLEGSYTDLHFHQVLQIVEVALLKCGDFLPLETRTQVDQFTLNLLLPYPHLSVLSPLSPLTDARARLSLFRILFASVLHPLLHLPSVVPYAVSLFTAGQCDPDSAVGLFCLQASAHCQTLLHPQRAPVVPLVADVSAEALFQYNMEKPKAPERARKPTTSASGMRDVEVEVAPYSNVDSVHTIPASESLVDDPMEDRIPEPVARPLMETNPTFAFASIQTPSSSAQKSKFPPSTTVLTEKAETFVSLSSFGEASNEGDESFTFVAASPDNSDVSSDEE